MSEKSGYSKVSIKKPEDNQLIITAESLLQIPKYFHQ